MCAVDPLQTSPDSCKQSQVDGVKSEKLEWHRDKWCARISLHFISFVYISRVHTAQSKFIVRIKNSSRCSAHKPNNSVTNK